MNKTKLSTTKLQQKFLRQTRGLWPALKGSLAKIYKPCIRKSCPACARGDKHPAWILSLSQKGRRRCLYVAEELVPTLKQAVRNGRRLEELLSRMGPALVTAYRRQRNQKRPENTGNRHV
jgi:hypothetical protein